MGDVVQLPPPAAAEPERERVWVDDQPGIYPDLPLTDYLADPVAAGSLSASGAKLLLPPGCPAKFRYWADHPADREPKLHFDLGTAVHTMVTGVGPAHITITARNKHGDPVTDYRTQAAQDEAAAIRDAGGVPLLLKHAEQVVGAVDALYAHPGAHALFTGTGIPEATVIWRDRETGAWCRCRPDRLPDTDGFVLEVPDLKTCDSADDEAVSRAMWNNGYGRQAAHVAAGLTALEVAYEIRPRLVFVEIHPPHLVRVIDPDEAAMETSRRQMAEALRVFAGCQESGDWSAYPDATLGFPRWTTRYELEG